MPVINRESATDAPPPEFVPSKKKVRAYVKVSSHLREARPEELSASYVLLLTAEEARDFEKFLRIGNSAEMNMSWLRSKSEKRKSKKP